MKRSRMFILTGILILFVVAVVLYISGPVIYSFTEPGTAGGGPHLVLWNPLRDRSPEKAADRFLTQFKDNCKAATAVLDDSPRYYQEICEKETEYPLLDWKLGFREDSGTHVQISYLLKRKESDDYQGQMSTRLVSLGTQWKVEAIEIVY